MKIRPNVYNVTGSLRYHTNVPSKASGAVGKSFIIMTIKALTRLCGREDTHTHKPCLSLPLIPPPLVWSIHTVQNLKVLTVSSWSPDREDPPSPQQVAHVCWRQQLPDDMMYLDPHYVDHTTGFKTPQISAYIIMIIQLITTVVKLRHKVTDAHFIYT